MPFFSCTQWNRQLNPATVFIQSVLLKHFPLYVKNNQTKFRTFFNLIIVDSNIDTFRATFRLWGWKLFNP